MALPYAPPRLRDSVAAPRGTSQRLSLITATGCALAVLLAVAATRPVSEMPFCDDFSYILSAIGLHDTGHPVYNGWAAAGLGWMLAYGALVIQLFGFSIAHIHEAMVPVGMGCAFLMHRICVRLSLANADAALATLTLTLSVLFLPLTFSFMSDVPGMLAFLLCLFLCLRALDAQSSRAACLWIIAAALSNAVGGTARQVAWVGLLTMVPATLWSYRRNRAVWLPAGAVWLLSLASMRLYLRWLYHQPFTLHENHAVLPSKHQLLNNVLQALVIMAFYLLPATVAFLLPRRTRVAVIVAALLTGAAGAGLLAHFAPLWTAPFTTDWVTTSGLVVPSIIGWRPTEISPQLVMALRLPTLATPVAVAFAAWTFLRGQRMLPLLSTPRALLLASTFTVTAILTLSRGTMFERYFLPLMALLLPVLLRLYRVAAPAGVPWLGVLVLALFTAGTVLTTHDEFATERARLDAANILIAHGIPRDRFWAGFDYDGWTQITKRGYLNDPRLGPPTAFWHAPTNLPPIPACGSWFAAWAPDIHPEAQLAFEPLTVCGPLLPGIQPLHYRTWLPPQDRTLYFLAVPPS